MCDLPFLVAKLNINLSVIFKNLSLLKKDPQFSERCLEGKVSKHRPETVYVFLTCQGFVLSECHADLVIKSMPLSFKHLQSQLDHKYVGFNELEEAFGSVWPHVSLSTSCTQ